MKILEADFLVRRSAFGHIYYYTIQITFIILITKQLCFHYAGRTGFLFLPFARTCPNGVRNGSAIQIPTSRTSFGQFYPSARTATIFIFSPNTLIRSDIQLTTYCICSIWPNAEPDELKNNTTRNTKTFCSKTF